MDEQRQNDQLEPTYNSSVPMQDVTLRTCQKQWMIEWGGGRGSEISMLMAQHDDYISYIYIYIYIYIWEWSMHFKKD